MCRRFLPSQQLPSSYCTLDVVAHLQTCSDCDVFLPIQFSLPGQQGFETIRMHERRPKKRKKNWMKFLHTICPPTWKRRHRRRSLTRLSWSLCDPCNMKPSDEWSSGGTSPWYHHIALAVWCFSMSDSPFWSHFVNWSSVNTHGAAGEQDVEVVWIWSDLLKCLLRVHSVCLSRVKTFASQDKRNVLLLTVVRPIQTLSPCLQLKSRSLAQLFLHELGCNLQWDCWRQSWQKTLDVPQRWSFHRVSAVHKNFRSPAVRNTSATRNWRQAGHNGDNELKTIIKHIKNAHTNWWLSKLFVQAEDTLDWQSNDLCDFGIFVCTKYSGAKDSTKIATQGFWHFMNETNMHQLGCMAGTPVWKRRAWTAAWAGLCAWGLHLRLGRYKSAAWASGTWNWSSVVCRSHCFLIRVATVSQHDCFGRFLPVVQQFSRDLVLAHGPWQKRQGKGKEKCFVFMQLGSVVFGKGSKYNLQSIPTFCVQGNQFGRTWMYIYWSNWSATRQRALSWFCAFKYNQLEMVKTLNSTVGKSYKVCVSCE